jgi:hypothetical protein
MYFMILGFENGALITCVSENNNVALYSRANIAAELKETRADMVEHPELEWRAVGFTDAKQRAQIARDCGAA